MEIDATSRTVELAKDFTVGDYLDAIAETPPNKQRIADGIYRRFMERYVEPVSSAPARHGFSMMAVACLTIEALESFRRGWPDTSRRGAGEHAFCSFFDAHDSFAPFRGHAREFYKGVRCGILHQAETTLGWKIRRDGDLLKIGGAIRTVNAKKFITALKQAIEAYRDQLMAAHGMMNYGKLFGSKWSEFVRIVRQNQRLANPALHRIAYAPVNFSLSI